MTETLKQQQQEQQQGQQQLCNDNDGVCETYNMKQDVVRAGNVLRQSVQLQIAKMNFAT